MAHDVFISYNEATSKAIMLRVVDALEKEGIRCWYAPRNVRGDFADSITDAIEKCRVFVVILNKAASESPHVKNELYIASECKTVEMLPFRISNDEFSNNIKYYLGRHHWINAVQNLDAGIVELIDRILRLLGRSRRSLNTSSEYITLNYCGETHRVKGETIQYSNGCVYIGEVVNGKRHGKGRLSWPTGDVYEGNFSEDLIHGKGKYVHASGNVYEGDYLFDKRHGMGKYTWVNGDVYEGAYSDGKKHGKGKVTWINGDVYEGNFADGKRSGYGVFKPAKGKILKGQFQDDKFIGK